MLPYVGQHRQFGCTQNIVHAAAPCLDCKHLMPGADSSTKAINSIKLLMIALHTHIPAADTAMIAAPPSHWHTLIVQGKWELVLVSLADAGAHTRAKKSNVTLATHAKKATPHPINTHWSSLPTTVGVVAMLHWCLFFFLSTCSSWPVHKGIKRRSTAQPCKSQI